VLGIVVDDAIVTGENIFSHMRRKKDGVQAAIDGTQEVAMPVTFGVLTTMAICANTVNCHTGAVVLDC